MVLVYITERLTEHPAKKRVEKVNIIALKYVFVHNAQILRAFLSIVYIDTGL